MSNKRSVGQTSVHEAGPKPRSPVPSTARARDAASPRTERVASTPGRNDVDLDASVERLTALLTDDRGANSARPVGPTREQVELRAYLIYLQRGGAPGHADEDWHQAERELALELRTQRRK